MGIITFVPEFRTQRFIYHECHETSKRPTEI